MTVKREPQGTPSTVLEARDGWCVRDGSRLPGEIDNADEKKGVGTGESLVK